jgi:hypothetical protein
VIELPQTYRTARWLLGILVLGLTICVGGLVDFIRRPGESIATIGFAVLVLLFVAGLAEALSNRIVLEHDRLDVRNRFKRKVVLASDVTRVVAEKGVPIALQLRDGRWYKIPSLGTGPQPNTLRAWVRRNQGGAPSPRRGIDV